MGKFENIAEEAESVCNLTDDHIKLYVESLVKRTGKGSVDHVAIEKVLADFSMPMKIADADARITTCCSDFFQRLESICCGDFLLQNPTKTVRLLMFCVQSPALKRELRRRVEFDESLEKNVKNSIRALVQEAVNCEVYGCDNAERCPRNRTLNDRLPPEETGAEERAPALISRLLQKKVSIGMWPSTRRNAQGITCAIAGNSEGRKGQAL